MNIIQRQGQQRNVTNYLQFAYRDFAVELGKMACAWKWHCPSTGATSSHKQTPFWYALRIYQGETIKVTAGFDNTDRSILMEVDESGTVIRSLLTPSTANVACTEQYTADKDMWVAIGNYNVTVPQDNVKVYVTSRGSDWNDSRYHK